MTRDLITSPSRKSDTSVVQDVSHSKVFAPGDSALTVRSADGRLIPVPQHWELLAPGDPMLTRRVKAAGDHWIVQEKKGRKIFSRGVFAPSTTIARLRIEVEIERKQPQYAQRKQADAQRREVKQAHYVDTFESAVLKFLGFASNHASIAAAMAKAVTAHATPVGSGTVARTERIPVEQRAEAAVIAWMRHQTTAYDTMVIARVRGKRREVRRELAERSRELLNAYRRGSPIDPNCPLQRALVTK